MRVHLVAGHDQLRDAGATATHPIKGKLKEADLTVEYRNLLRKELGLLGVSTTVDNDQHSLREVIANLQRTVSPNDLVVDIHFNAFTNPNATGAEVLIKNSATDFERQIATQLNNQIADTLKIANRGVKPESQSARGRLGIMQLPCRVVLLELAFLSNPNDMNAYHKWKFILASRHADTIHDFVTSNQR